MQAQLTKNKTIQWDLYTLVVTISVFLFLSSLGQTMQTSDFVAYYFPLNAWLTTDENTYFYH